MLSIPSLICLSSRTMLLIDIETDLISFSSVLELASVKTRAPSEKIVDFARLDVIWEASNEEGLDVKEVMIGVARGSTGRQMHMQMHLHLVMGVGVGWDGKISQNRNSNLLQYWNYVDVSLSNTKLDIQQLGDNPTPAEARTIVSNTSSNLRSSPCNTSAFFILQTPPHLPRQVIPTTFNPALTLRSKIKPTGGEAPRDHGIQIGANGSSQNDSNRLPVKFQVNQTSDDRTSKLDIFSMVKSSLASTGPQMASKLK
ncbi:hypothetical protein MRB53_013626 [Persea americana]|uniref:Uncharacterized protein n=1 Tax=Persea americana TaxID=3435 RepID=A0ACC2K8I0_PERAE|nr:hypothetical protein MRB53_013626 [Persea americana]